MQEIMQEIRRVALPVNDDEGNKRFMQQSMRILKGRQDKIERIASK